jgi:hypothetical protein
VVVAVAVAVNNVAGNSDVAVAGACLLATLAYVPIAVPMSAMRGVWHAVETRLGRDKRRRVKLRRLPRRADARVDVQIDVREVDGMADGRLAPGESAAVQG